MKRRSHRRPRTAIIAVCIAAVATDVLISACGGANFNGHLVDTDGSSSSKSEVSAGLMTGFKNTSGNSVTIRSARLIPIRGYRLPSLRSVRLMVDNAGVSTLANSSHAGRSATGDVVRDGKSAYFVYIVKAPGPGRYEAAGIRFTVTVGGSRETVNAYGGGAVCDTVGRRHMVGFQCFRQ
jgi:hypothetical protein